MGPVATFDADLDHTRVQQPADQPPQADSGVLDHEPVQDIAGGVDDAGRVVVLGPIDTRADSRGCIHRG